VGDFPLVKWVFCADPESTAALGERLGAKVRPGSVISLSGPLGSGKSVFARGFARGLGVTERVQSPTFALMYLHENGRLPLAHVDLYRLSEASELALLGLDEILAEGGVVAVEWAERFPDALPAERLEIAFFEVDPEGTPAPPDGRWLRIHATGPAHASLEEAAHA
jgi:tRNA threonylcarbamoyladenosine biosynthesis protein TsaE